MKRVKRIAFTVILSLMLLLAGSVLVQAANVTGKITGQINYTESYRFLNKLNNLRKSKGLKTVKMDKALMDAAIQRAAEISVLYSHTRPNGKSCSTASKYIKAENISITQNASTAYTGWKNSPGHYRNMTNASMSSVGIACFKVNNQVYWVNLFGTKSAQQIKKSGKTKVTRSVAVNDRNLKNANIFYDGPYTMQSECSKQILMHYDLKNAERGGYLPTDMFTYKSSNSAVCKVSKTGKVTSGKEGKAVITVTLKKKPSVKKKVTVTVDDGYWSYGDEEFDD